tara:strand:- start:285 stop:437 length:153 start_codon:yes stop_codon:yes gene_type:complete
MICNLLISWRKEYLNQCRQKVDGGLNKAFTREEQIKIQITFATISYGSWH